MPRRVEEPGVITEWRRSSRERSTAQYAPLVRKFLNSERITNVATVDKTKIERYVLAIADLPMRTKTVSALRAFFGYLIDSNVIHDDPSRHLARSVSQSRKTKVLVEKLKQAGMREVDASRVYWRDIAELAIRRANSRSRVCLPARESPVIHELVENFLKRAAICGAEGLDALLESRLD